MARKANPLRKPYKRPFPFRPRLEDAEAIDFLMERTGLNFSNVIRMALHRFAIAEGMASRFVPAWERVADGGKERAPERTPA